jgi:hypothetical protein
VENNFRSYAFIEGGIGIWENDNKDIFAMPFAYTVGGGGGTDIYLLDDFSICLEAGLLMHLLDGEWKGGGLFQISWRAYF